MKFTLNWLKDHLDTDADLDTIVERLTAIGLEVDDVDDRAAFQPFTIARVLTAEKHPDADKLQVLKVDIGKGDPLQVVCGAPNARAGMIGVLATPGTYVPGLDVTLSVGKIRGVESYGMMCSEQELLLSQDHNGIIELPVDAPVGSSFAAYAGLDDPIIDVGLTPNRPDCTSIRGIARDLAAAGLGTLKPQIIEDVVGDKQPSLNVTLDFGDTPSLCLGFAYREITNVENKPSPRWMQQRLLAIGLRPINALVDITNYLTFDQGRPLHVFDADKVKGNLTVRRAQKGEKILALNGKEYELGPDHCVIADENGLESIAGVMGGEASGCDDNTRNVLVESALWDPRAIAMTGRELGIVSDARYRFERGVDPLFMIPGLEQATRLIMDLCGGTPSQREVVSFTPPEEKVIDFPFSETKRLTSLDIAPQQASAILTALGFGVTELDSNTARVTVPSWRPDIDGKADLVEEIIRIYGLDQVEAQMLPGRQGVATPILTPMQIRTRTVKRTLAARAMLEAVTYSFISEKAAQTFGGGQAELKLANPIAADMTYMRPSLLPGLLLAAQRNVDRGFDDFALFEVSDIYNGATPEDQRRVATGIRVGSAQMSGAGRFWSGNGQKVGVYDAKADALAVLEACGVQTDKVQIEAQAPDWYHPGRSGVIKQGPKIILGSFGEFHPETLKNLDVDGPVCGFEIYLDAIPQPRKKQGKSRGALNLSPYQMLRRDFAFIVDNDIQAAALIKAAAGADKKLIHDVKIFDVFSGPSLGENKKSIALEVMIQPFERTLTDKDLEALSERIIANVEKATNGVLRK